MKPGEFQHDVAVFRAARIEQVRLLEQGAVLKRSVSMPNSNERSPAPRRAPGREAERKRRTRPASRRRRR